MGAGAECVGASSSELTASSCQVWLLEMNCNPALHTNCEVLEEVVPRTVVETLGQLVLTC